MIKQIKYFVDLLLYSNTFMALCSVAMATETFIYLDHTPDPIYLGFLFSSTLVLYNSPAISGGFLFGISQRHDWVLSNKKIIVTFFLLGIIGTAICALYLPLPFIAGFFPTAILAFSYFFPFTGIRKLALTKVLVVTLVWLASCILYPYWLSLASFPKLTLSPELLNFLILNSLFFIPLCIIFLIRDIESDKKEGANPFPFTRSPKVMVWISLFITILFVAAVFYSNLNEQWQLAYVLTSGVALSVIAFASDKRSDHYFSLLVDGLILIKVIFVCAFAVF